MTSTPIEAARLLFRKAEHDLDAAKKLSIDGPLDIACYHFHQAVEKYIKALLQAHDVEFPRTHDLDALLDICLSLGSDLESFRTPLESFIPYAIQLRYEWDYEPTAKEVSIASHVADSVRARILNLLPQLADTL